MVLQNTLPRMILQNDSAKNILQNDSVEQNHSAVILPKQKATQKAETYI